MYFTKIRLNGLQVIDLPIVGALPSDLYILKSADGLGPPEVDVSIADTLNAGGVYQGRRPQSREIVLLIALNPDFKVGQTAADLRTALYGMLTPGHIDRIVVDILDDEDLLASTSGYAKKLEIVPFSKDPEVQLTIACVQQYLIAPETLYISPPDKAAPLIPNVGTAPAGFRMELTFSAALTEWVLSDFDGQTEMRIVYPFAIGDKLMIDTRPGRRGIWVDRGGIETNIIFALTQNSIWYMLHGGDNIFATSSQAFEFGDVFYTPQFWGI